MFGWWIVVILIIVIVGLALGWGGHLGLHRDTTTQDQNAAPHVAR
jgi:hypothetical protein